MSCLVYVSGDPGLNSPGTKPASVFIRPHTGRPDSGYNVSNPQEESGGAHPGTPQKEQAMQIGAHVSSAGGISKSIDRGLEIGCEAIQIFGSSARTWAFKHPPEKEIAAFKERRAETGMGAVFFHAIYLINLGSPIRSWWKRASSP